VESNERWVSYEAGRYVLLGRPGVAGYPLLAGTVVELCVGGRFQPVRVASGGYCGWYYVMDDGRRGRFALGMQARLCPAVSVAGVGRVSDEPRG